MKKQSGITLISLVVTIIVLIILAGVSINLILGQDGIITKAREAKQNMELAQVEEQEQLNELYTQMSGESNGTLSYDAIAKLVEFKKEIASAITDMGIETEINADASTMASNIKSILNNVNATSVSYDNTESGLTANNMQDAIDEVENSLNDLIISKAYEKDVIVDGGKAVAVTVDNWEVPEGYTIISIIPYCGSMYISAELGAGSTGKFKVRNFGTETLTVTLRVNVVYMKIT